MFVMGGREHPGAWQQIQQIQQIQQKKKKEKSNNMNNTGFVLDRLVCLLEIWKFTINNISFLYWYLRLFGQIPIKLVVAVKCVVV